jgi:glycosyltransferase involved in cell wall biosynthesis
MRILVLNWRDIKSRRGGGAERVTHEVARRLVERGDEVTWLSSAEPELEERELVDGVDVVRRGTELTTRRWAPGLAAEVRPHVVLEEINTLPYFAPLWADVPVVLYMNQLAREVWWYEAPLPLAVVGRVVEPAYLRVYRNCDAVTISHSTLADLRDVGVRGAVTIAPMAVDVPRAAARPTKSRAGRLVAIGRLTPSKRYDHAIEALALLRRAHPDASLTLIGRGRDEERLRELAARLGVESAVDFAGFVSEQEKEEILDAADVLVGTSVREGWGLTVTEAAARGTPSVVYDIAGFRDAVVPGRTGLVVEPEPAALAAGIGRLLDDEQLYERVAAGAWDSVTGLTYDATADAFASALARAAGQVSRPRG